MAIRISRVYTRSGDGGTTRLTGGQELSKDARRIEAYGCVDELNATIGVVVELARGQSEQRRRWGSLIGWLVRIQNELFDVGALLATLPEDRHESMPRIRKTQIRRLERLVDRCNEKLPELQSFVLPGGGPVSAALHVSRTVCRRAEREVVRLYHQEPGDAELLHYLNRLSDLLFVLSRWAADVAGEAEQLWVPGSAR